MSSMSHVSIPSGVALKSKQEEKLKKLEEKYAKVLARQE